MDGKILRNFEFSFFVVVVVYHIAFHWFLQIYEACIARDFQNSAWQYILSLFEAHKFKDIAGFYTYCEILEYDPFTNKTNTSR